MSRTRLRKALGTRQTDGGAIVPLLEAHAARLEQLNDDHWPVDAEAQARMLRAAQALYELDAVTIGGGGLLAAIACWLAKTPAMGGDGARAAIVGGQRLAATPPASAVAGASSIMLARDVLRRLRAVLGDRAGIAVVLPDASGLAGQLGLAGETAWTGEVLTEIVRAIGADEPDLFLLVGDDALDPTLESLGDFFGVPILAIGAAAPPGVVASSIADLVAGREARPGWLYTTKAEIEPTTDPAALRSALARLRAG